MDATQLTESRGRAARGFSGSLEGGSTLEYNTSESPGVLFLSCPTAVGHEQFDNASLLPSHLLCINPVKLYVCKQDKDKSSVEKEEGKEADILMDSAWTQ